MRDRPDRSRTVRAIEVTMLSYATAGSNQLERAKAFYDDLLASAELGAKDEGAPGFRGGSHFTSYFRDPDGNKLCAYHQAQPV